MAVAAANAVEYEVSLSVEKDGGVSTEELTSPARATHFGMRQGEGRDLQGRKAGQVRRNKRTWYISLCRICNTCIQHVKQQSGNCRPMP